MTAWRSWIGSPGRLYPLLLMTVLLASVAHAQSLEVLRVGVYHNPPKLLLLDDRLSGIFGDLLQHIAEREGWLLEPVPCGWNHCLELLREGRIDLMPDVAINDVRDQDFSFHQTPVLRSWSQLYSSAAINVASLLDLDGLRIAVLEGSVQQTYLADLMQSFDLEVRWVAVPSFEQGFVAVRDGRADAVAANHLFGDQRARDLGFFVTPVLFQPSRLYFAGRQGLDSTVLEVLDRYLGSWQAEPDSLYFRILQRWGVGGDESDLPDWLYPVAGAGLLLLAVALWLAWLMRRTVAAKASELQLAETRLETILDNIDACIYTKGLDHCYRYVNRRQRELFGREASALLGATDDDLYDQATAQHQREVDTRVLTRGERSAEEEVVTFKGGGSRTFLTIKLPLRDPAGRVYALCGVATDISSYLQLREELNHAQYFDTVTGLANRVLLLERLSQGLASAQRTGLEGAVVTLDFTAFGLVNETFGFPAGDELLRQVAARITALVTKADVAARIGADDFTIVLTDLSGDRDTAVLDARRWVSALTASLSEPFQLAGTNQAMSFSVGISMFSDAGAGASSDASTLLRNSELALAGARRDGAMSVRFFDPAMQRGVDRRLKIESALRQALEQHSFELFLQPQVDCDQRVIGGEILLRWRHPELGDVAPGEFIPVAESSGLIIPLGNWVLQQACQILRDWQAEPLLSDLTLAINISPRQFRHGDFVEEVERSIRQYNLRPSLIELEVTEGMLITDVADTVARMERLTALGVRFSLDDFGTGYASLSYLKRLPLYRLKIDYLFVRDLLTDNNDQAIIAATLQLGRSLGLDVIAEGVESSGQLEQLKVMGCEKFQGFYLGLPEPVSHWAIRLRQSRQLVSAG
ncbi:EAL domain-containing protein [Haliea sp. E1-2-M8]|uniref:EAL domain-containing protein n=1 Tax=Haliea sp. E1-2-M8 TaxID=3064706 RepID=UPI0027285294|nr:EAL domain-containing protein [Haliea sp. E1-2-M8]MDO8861026.1 EAL domain-containing protein [Haliea sp. E1-2-M8]